MQSAKEIINKYFPAPIGLLELPHKLRAEALYSDRVMKCCSELASLFSEEEIKELCQKYALPHTDEWYMNTLADSIHKYIQKKLEGK